MLHFLHLGLQTCFSSASLPAQQANSTWLKTFIAHHDGSVARIHKCLGRFSHRKLKQIEPAKNMFKQFQIKGLNGWGLWFLFSSSYWFPLYKSPHLCRLEQKNMGVCNASNINQTGEALSMDVWSTSWNQGILGATMGKRPYPFLQMGHGSLFSSCLVNLIQIYFENLRNSKLFRVTPNSLPKSREILGNPNSGTQKNPKSLEVWDLLMGPGKGVLLGFAGKIPNQIFTAEDSQLNVALSLAKSNP